MGKKKTKMKTTQLNLGGKRLIEFHTASLNKHGELKGKNKKETRVIRDTCMHHKIGKKGKLKSRVDLIGDNMGHCTMCCHEFTITPYTKEDRKKIISDVTEMTDQTKFMAAAIGADESTQRALAEFSVGIRNLNRINKQCTKMVKKEDQLSKKNKKNKQRDYDLGNWAIRNR